jgi:hypothetical protein
MVLALADTLTQEPLLISRLVRSACQQMARQALERMLCRVSLTDEQLKQFSDVFGNTDQPEGMKRSFAGERCSGIQIFGMSEHDLHEMFSQMGEAESTLDLSFSLGFRMMRISGYLDLDEIYYLGARNLKTGNLIRACPKSLVPNFVSIFVEIPLKMAYFDNVLRQCFQQRF